MPKLKKITLQYEIMLYVKTMTSKQKFLSEQTSLLENIYLVAVFTFLYNLSTYVLSTQHVKIYEEKFLNNHLTEI